MKTLDEICAGVVAEACRRKAVRDIYIGASKYFSAQQMLMDFDGELERLTDLIDRAGDQTDRFTITRKADIQRLREMLVQRAGSYLATFPPHWRALLSHPPIPGTSLAAE